MGSSPTLGTNMKYYTSDLHFGHSNIISFCNRPFSNVEEMDATLVRRWNEKITNTDDVYMLGDFCFKREEFIRYMKQLNGIKHVILGNHDPHGIRHDENAKKLCMFHEAIHEIKDNGQKIVLCHFPLHEWLGFYHKTIHFHGHTHGTIGASFREGAYDVGVDVRGFEPKTLQEIIS